MLRIGRGELHHREEGRAAAPGRDRQHAQCDHHRVVAQERRVRPARRRGEQLQVLRSAVGAGPDEVLLAAEGQAARDPGFGLTRAALPAQARCERILLGMGTHRERQADEQTGRAEQGTSRGGVERVSHVEAYPLEACAAGALGARRIAL